AFTGELPAKEALDQAVEEGNHILMKP
ncbi:MAG: hypothetical protein K1000chlam3_00792, partial [Chlamydiae bacterium]|nr:hypothetical protein [Chlamydiota bacterium]